MLRCLVIQGYTDVKGLKFSYQSFSIDYYGEIETERF